MKFSLLAVAACVSLAIAGEKPPTPQHNPEKSANSVGSNNYCNCAKKKEDEDDDEDSDNQWGISRRMVQMLGPRTCPCAREVDQTGEVLRLQKGNQVMVADASQVHPNESD